METSRICAREARRPLEKEMEKNECDKLIWFITRRDNEQLPEKRYPMELKRKGTRQVRRVVQKTAETPTAPCMC